MQQYSIVQRSIIFLCGNFPRADTYSSSRRTALFLLPTEFESKWYDCVISSILCCIIANRLCTTDLFTDYACTSSMKLPKGDTRSLTLVFFELGIALIDCLGRRCTACVAVFAVIGNLDDQIMRFNLIHLSVDCMSKGNRCPWSDPVQLFVDRAVMDLASKMAPIMWLLVQKLKLNLQNLMLTEMCWLQALLCAAHNQILISSFSSKPLLFVCLLSFVDYRNSTTVKHCREVVPGDLPHQLTCVTDQDFTLV